MVTPSTLPPIPIRSTPEETAVLALLRDPDTTYEDIQRRLGWSRGRIYGLALRCGARKTEDRIRERAEEKARRQAEFLLGIVNTTIRADVLELLNGIPDESVQLTITSPPYNIAKAYGGYPSADRMRPVYYHGWMLQIISEIARTLKPGGVVFLQVGTTLDSTGQRLPLDVLFYDGLQRSGLVYQSRVAWIQPHGLTPAHRLAERYETALVFSKGPRPTFNPTPARRPQRHPDKRAFKGPNRGQLSGHPLGAWPTDVWDDVGSVRHNHPDRRFGEHPAQFPLKLAKRAILLYSMPGDLVMDPFSGSGTVAVGAKEAGRNFIDADLFYDQLRAQRLAATVPDTVCPLPGVTEESLALRRQEALRSEGPTRAIPATTEQQMVLDVLRELGSPTAPALTELEAVA